MRGAATVAGARAAGEVIVLHGTTEGLLPAPARSEGNLRLYEARHLERLQFIRHCRSLDMSLAEIRSLLAAG